MRSFRNYLFCFLGASLVLTLIHSTLRNGGVTMHESMAAGFSAEYVMEDVNAPANSSSGKIYVNLAGPPRGSRRESLSGKYRRISIWRQDPPLNVTLDPASRTFWRTTSDSVLMSAPMADAQDQILRREFVGQEVIDGRKTGHWRIFRKDNTGAPATYEYWEDAKLLTQLRIVGPGITYRLFNVREGPQSPGLFAPPEHFVEVPAPTL